MPANANDGGGDTSFVPHKVPRNRYDNEESWSEWQDLNLRPSFRTRLGLSLWSGLPVIDRPVAS